MGQVDTFGPYVERRLDSWGREFALHRDCEYLGHASPAVTMAVYASAVSGQVAI